MLRRTSGRLCHRVSIRPTFVRGQLACVDACGAHASPTSSCPGRPIGANHRGRGRRSICAGRGFLRISPEWGGPKAPVLPAPVGSGIALAFAQAGEKRIVSAAYRVSAILAPADYDAWLRRAAGETRDVLELTSCSNLLRTCTEAVTYDDHEVTNQQRRGGANFQYCNDIHENLLLCGSDACVRPHY